MSVRRTSLTLRSDAAMSPGYSQTKRMRSVERTTNRKPSHRRSASDPFDAPDGGDLELEYKTTEFLKVFPTLLRYPVAESQDRNCWSQPPANEFKVRGPDYLKDSKKVPSEDFLLRARGCDLLLTENPDMFIGGNPRILAGLLRQLPSLLLNFRFPWGYLVAYFEVPEKLTPFMRGSEGDQSILTPESMEGMTPAEVTACRFLAGDIDHKNGALKLIPAVVEGPFIVRTMVTGRPVIIGNKLPVTYDYHPADEAGAAYLEVSLNVGNSSTAAKRIVSVCRRYMNSLTVDIGFVIQGDSADELPEQMLGAVRLHGVDPLKAPTLAT
mmetsp:Transcript_9702/g.15022  ORF Transcript_9702/g.15022 Transcript_9702/m.15022 type:complete len:325 (+) Transcript_9702:75-1049(+)